MTATKKAGAKAPAPIGFWVDETIPDLTELLAPHGIDAGSFGAWLGPQLGVYRGNLTVKTLMPTPGEEREAAQQLVKDLAAVLAHLAPGRIPPVAAAQLHLALYKAGKSWHDIYERLQMDLVVMQWAAQQVAAKLESWPSKRGRKSAAPRDRLLADVENELRRLRVSATDAAPLAQDILRACRVASVGEDDSVRKAIRRGKK